MSEASIEATLELRAASLRDVKTRMRPLFAQERAAVNAVCSWTDCLAMSGASLDGCAPRPRAIPGLGGSMRSLDVTGREADALRDMVGEYGIERLADDDAVLAGSNELASWYA